MVSDAVDSFTYAFDQNLIVLYLAVFLGQLLRWVAGNAPLPIRNGLLRTLFGLPFRLAGTVLVVGGVVGILHYVVRDVTGAADEHA